MENPILTQEKILQIRRTLNFEPLYLDHVGNPLRGSDRVIKLTLKKWGVDPKNIHYYFKDTPQYKNYDPNRVTVIYTMGYDCTDHAMLINNIFVG
jgi:hypothetical protein